MNLAQLIEQAEIATTDPKILADLAEHENLQVRQRVAANPNTPQKVLEKLSQEFPDEIVQNPIFSLLLLEQGDSRFIQLTQARSSITTPEKKEKLAQSSYVEVVKAIASNLSTPVYLLERLANIHYPLTQKNSADVEILSALCANPNTPLELLIDLAQTEIVSILKVIASNLKTPINLLEQFANIPYQSTKYDVADEVLVHMAVAANPNTPPRLLEHLAAHKEGFVTQKVAANPHTPLPILYRLAQAYYQVNHLALSQNPQTPEDLLAQIAAESINKEPICLAIAVHQNTNIITLQKLANSKFHTVATQATMALNHR